MPDKVGVPDLLGLTELDAVLEGVRDDVVVLLGLTEGVTEDVVVGLTEDVLERVGLTVLDPVFEGVTEGVAVYDVVGERDGVPEPEFVGLLDCVGVGVCVLLDELLAVSVNALDILCDTELLTERDPLEDRVTFAVLLDETLDVGDLPLE